MVFFIFDDERNMSKSLLFRSQIALNMIKIDSVHAVESKRAA